MACKWPNTLEIFLCCATFGHRAHCIWRKPTWRVIVQQSDYLSSQWCHLRQRQFQRGFCRLQAPKIWNAKFVDDKRVGQLSDEVFLLRSRIEVADNQIETIRKLCLLEELGLVDPVLCCHDLVTCTTEGPTHTRARTLRLAFNNKLRSHGCLHVCDVLSRSLVIFGCCTA